ncbi:GlxA family transcriptional regulator [Kitasatospora sp. NBC_01539]|uniref:GlxA family transcriptional regulator n=1 Tax=Kitasatospora sp. NBC_01539 TaxID=2903577 RepID=UPI0038601F3A
MTRVVFLLAPRVHLLDLAGPAQVFSSAADIGHRYETVYVGEQEDIPTAQGIGLRAGTSWPAPSADDLVVVPGWRSPVLPRGPVFGRATLERLVAHREAGGTVASVCSGADALGRAGLLDGRRCTTHHDLQDELALRYPRAAVVPDVLFVEDRGVVTSAGIASGIDLALHLLAVRHGPYAAARVARTMVVHTRRNGDQRQESAMLRHRAHLSDVVHRVQDVIDARFTDPLLLAGLAEAAGVSERTLTRRFVRATGCTPLRYQQELRLEHAEHLIGQGSTVESAARAVGFLDARMLRRLRARPSAA